MIALPSFALLLSLAPMILSQESVDVVYANHRYVDGSSEIEQTPRTFPTSVVNHLTQRVPAHQSSQRRLPYTWPRNTSSAQPPRMVMAKRSGDYHYIADYPQYDIDDHGHSHHNYHLRTMPYPYPHYPVHEKPSSHRFDITSIGIIAFLKLIIVKILAFGFFKIILLLALKIPIILFALGFKFLIILKLIKLVKLLTIPFLIPFLFLLLLPFLFLALSLLLPLLLAPLIPLLLIPILLPLLLSLPVPVLAPAATAATTGRRRRRAADAQARNVQDDVLYLVRRVLESEQCIERVACQFAANKQSRGYNSYVAWYLERAAAFVRKPRFLSYKDAYKKGVSGGVTPQQCTRLYACNNPRKAL